MAEGLSRRRFMQRWGSAAALPLVVAVMTARPAYAVTKDIFAGCPGDGGGDGSPGPDAGCTGSDTGFADSPPPPDSAFGTDSFNSDVAGGPDSLGGFDLAFSDATSMADITFDVRPDA